MSDDRHQGQNTDKDYQNQKEKRIPDRQPDENTENDIEKNNQNNEVNGRNKNK